MHYRSLIAAVSLALIGGAPAGARSAKPPRAAAAANGEITETKPELVGFSSERLATLDGNLKALVDGKQLAGVVWVVARHGKIVDEKSYGNADLASQKPMQKDAIFRIFSMTKPITGIAMMMLYEEGKWKPSDPISRYIPEFRDLKVFSGVDKDGKPTFDAPGHAPTMGELMSHTAGFTYGVFGATPVDKMYQEAQLLAAPSLKDFIDRVSKLPLLYQPGEGWVYSISVDIQGYLVEKLSGKSFPDFVRERIFEPLGMKDTAFYVPARKTRPRCDDLSRRPHRALGHAARPGDFEASRTAVRRRWTLLDGAGLSAIHSDGIERRRTKWRPPCGAELHRAHAHESCTGRREKRQ